MNDKEPSAALEHFAALEHLRRDPVLAALLARMDELLPPLPFAPDPFAALVRAVIGQQVSVKAADAIAARLRQVAPRLAAEEIAALSGETLRAQGLSWAKVRTVQALAQRTAEGVIDFDRLAEASEEDVIAVLSAVPGIGRWTAEMFLLFALGRPDVFSWGDAGLRKAVRLLYGPGAGPEVAGAWSPHRSLASRLLWHALNTLPALTTL